MFDKLLLIIILFFQMILTGIIYANVETDFNFEIFFQIVQIFLIGFGFFWGYKLLKKEIQSNRRLAVYEKLSDILVEKLHASLYELGPSLLEKFYIEKSNPKNSDDYHTNILRDNSKKLSSSVSKFSADLQFYYEYFEIWDSLFSKKVRNEIKFIFDLGSILSDQIWKYQRILSLYAYTSLLKSKKDIECEKKNLISMESDISKMITVFSNGLNKLSLDIKEDITKDLDLKNLFKDKHFSLELENSNNGDKGIFLTENGFEYGTYQKTKFQEKYGGFQERRLKLKKMILKDKSD